MAVTLCLLFLGGDLASVGSTHLSALLLLRHLNHLLLLLTLLLLQFNVNICDLEIGFWHLNFLVLGQFMGAIMLLLMRTVVLVP